MPKRNKKKLFRIATTANSLDVFLKGQLEFLNRFYHVVGVSSGKKDLKIIEEREGVRTVNISMKRDISPLKDLYSLFCFIALFIKEKPYIIHTNSPKASLLSIIAAWICRVPHRIYTVTGLRFETTTGRQRQLLLTMEKITCKFATKVIPEGMGVRKTLLENKITNKPLQVIHNGNINGVDLDYFSKENVDSETTDSLKEKIGIEKNNFVYVFVGRLARDKGIDELVNAFSLLYNEDSTVKLLLVGYFEQETNLISKEARKIIEENKGIIYAGYQDDIRPYLAIADIFVLPSYREGFPNVVLQAGAMTLPCIVTDVNGSNEIIIDGFNGKIIPIKDEQALLNSMRYFKDNRKEVERMRTNTKSLISEKYDQKDVLEALLNEYNSL